MRYLFKPFFTRAIGLLGLLGLCFVQVGCAHSVLVEPSVSVHSRIGHSPVYAHVAVPGPVIYAPPPPVFYAPPPPRVVYVPRVVNPFHGWRPGHHHHGVPYHRGGGHHR
jgi:hypothetical protein